MNPCNTALLKKLTVAQLVNTCPQSSMQTDDSFLCSQQPIIHIPTRYLHTMFQYYHSIYILVLQVVPLLKIAQLHFARNETL
jgi:hypothetical protein